MDRRSLLGALGGVTVGGAAGFFAGLQARVPESENLCFDARGKVSYAQQGEDLVVKNILDTLHVTSPTYLDIGAFDPIRDNNTFLLYRSGGRGVLVEPNPAYTEKLAKERPGDVVLPVGIGVTSQSEADYYVFRDRPQLNTFSKEQADKLIARHGQSILERVLKLSLVSINGVIEKQLSGRAPDFVSIDVEGLDLAILKTLDLSRFRPRLFCVETLELGARSLVAGIADFMRDNGYSARGGSFVNTIFADERWLASGRDAG